MKKYLLVLFISIIFLIFAFGFKLPTQAQFASFEIYNVPGNPRCKIDLDCTSYPLVVGKFSGPEDDEIIITANAYDVSGIAIVMAIIEHPLGEKSRITMQPVGMSYVAIVDTSEYSDGEHTVYISATDMLFNNSMDQGNEYNIGTFTIGGSNADWLEGWTYRKKITIQTDNVDADLTDFPLYVKLSADEDIGDEALVTGYNIRFTSSDGTTLLPYERESWTGGAGTDATADFWVKTAVADGDGEDATDIYIYYGNASAGDGQGIANVWDKNYKAVYHLKEIGNVNKWADSTSNGNDGRNMNGVVPITGKIAGAGNFINDPYDYMNMRYSYIESTKNIGVAGNSHFTIETWIYPRYNLSDGYGRCMVGWGDESPHEANFFYYNSVEKSFEVGFFADDKDTSGNYPDNNWYHSISTYDGTNSRVFVNGIQALLWTPNTALMDVSDTKVMIGTDPFPYQWRYFDGLIDEVRISNISRSSDWIKFEYHNINESDNEIYFNIEETE